jgi:hypothetical protein
MRARCKMRARSFLGQCSEQGMKRIKTKNGGKSAKRISSAGKGARKPVDLVALREQITRLVGNEALAMVRTTIGEVEKGHYLAMKYLFEMIGLSPATTPEEAPQQDSLARTLLRRLQLPEETDASAEVTNEIRPEAVVPADMP